MSYHWFLTDRQKQRKQKYRCGLGYLVPYDGYFVTAPSTSPENTFTASDHSVHSVTFGSTMDCSILKELFGNYLKACEILDITDLMNEAKTALKKLPPFKIGKEGQLQEWYLDYPEVDVHHRHVSQLYGLYPGNLIHREDEELLVACRVALDRRGDEGTGWCMAWKACLWSAAGPTRICSVHIRHFRSTGISGLRLLSWKCWYSIRMTGSSFFRHFRRSGRMER